MRLGLCGRRGSRLIGAFGALAELLLERERLQFVELLLRKQQTAFRWRAGGGGVLIARWAATIRVAAALRALIRLRSISTRRGRR